MDASQIEATLRAIKQRYPGGCTIDIIHSKRCRSDHRGRNCTCIPKITVREGKEVTRQRQLSEWHDFYCKIDPCTCRR